MLRMSVKGKTMSLSSLNLRLIPGLGLCLCLFFSLFYFMHGKGSLVGENERGRSSREDSGISRHIQYSFTLQNERDRVLDKAELWVRAPLKKTGAQSCERVRASHPFDSVADDWGNEILHFTFRDLPPFSTKIIGIQANLLLSDRPNPIPSEKVDSFLKAERFIESDDPAILKKARALKQGKPEATVESIFRWVAENVRYAGGLPNDRGALYAFKKREGDCSEFSYLFAALCRACGIPARVLGGYVCTGDAILDPGGYHNWAQFHLDGSWHLADPQRKVFMKDSSRYVAMEVKEDGKNDPMKEFHRFRFSGNGLTVKMSQ